MRRYVEEPEIYLATRKAISAGAAPARATKLNSKDHLKTTILASLLATGVLGGNHMMLTWVPTYLKLRRGTSVTLINICGSFLGYLVSLNLSDTAIER
ncbi:hypothetical protein J8I87_02245 [Paraburkholderia sp. LEh10]|uniref:hypothetical protein n=1 Tax=Paraburkholderia sp. LEh10 TaxID=2821353 RepID=UPI001AE88BCC|nr:hypothetical protein [Paraburkholderia sp. LEh10]MBP0588556.1 hypothetical protein [Paraburkholderia sp. LEh10]